MITTIDPGFPQKEACRLIWMSLEEDLGSGDVSTIFSIPPQSQSHAVFIAKAPGVICGLPLIDLVFRELRSYSFYDQEFPNIQFKVTESESVDAGQILAEVVGSTHLILAAERTILNFIQHLSGIATYTKKFTEILVNTHCRILDTRKTLPGYRALHKYAVKQGGGTNHRMGLYDQMLLKDNHIQACGGMAKLSEKIILEKPLNSFIEVEVETLEQLTQILKSPVDQIMLDNMTDETMEQAVQIVRSTKPQAKIEASGNMSLDRIKALKNMGLDFISVGAITHSVNALDISLRIKEL